MGARGLLYHALVASMLVDAAVAADASCIPSEVRRGEFAAMLTSRLDAEVQREARSLRQAHSGSSAREVVPSV